MAGPYIREASSFNPRARVGATQVVGLVAATATFQSARPRGRDILAPLNAGFGIEFQSARPRGRDRSFRTVARPPSGFNPRARVGATSRSGRLSNLVWGFNPRARVGATIKDFRPCSITKFQSARPRGRDIARRLKSGPGERFNPRARVGAT